MTVATAKHDCPYSQEPRIGGNSGNSGNSQAGRGFQPFPPNKKSGNKWEHTTAFQYKRAIRLPALVITVPTKIGVGTKWEQKKTPGGRVFTGLFPPFPLFPPFLNSQEHLYVSNPGMVTP
ncbi:hypothetical protein [Pseudomonas koreensis]|uniref:hypothetical protein n=1 Tax=Pseudomonas koreensis TaxID=198620 RepID=UPI0018E67D9A|nr:hypothetical protein [Pseudomonas koreensis]MBI6947106.1 hypothetical protein [Pseudomonas koreensis]